MKVFPYFICLIGLSFFLAGCGGDTTSPPQHSTAPSQQATSDPEPSATPEPDPKDQIADLLQAYYQDLSQEQLDETKYFATTLDKFFNSKDVSRETVAGSIRKGFESIESRSISLDKNSITITSTSAGYMAEFKGMSSVTRTGESSPQAQAFHNLVGFNKDFQITSYEAVSSQASKSRQLAPKQSGNSIEAVAKAILPEFRTARFARTLQYIHPEKGYYLLTHPGAVSVPIHSQKIEELFAQAPWLKKGMTNLSATTKVEEHPEFDCGIMFSKEGSFLNECPPYTGVSELMATLAAYELGSYEPEQIDHAKDLEQYISHALIDTEEAIGFYFGQIEGEWYLLVVDIASYDCSA
ncbi:MAG: hypothetical protein AAF587_37520 [Bacteroidota bacterium]